MNITNGINNIINIYKESNYEVVRYNFNYNNHKVSLFYSSLHGLDTQIHIKFYIDKNQYFLPFDIETKDYNNSTIKTINPYLGDYYKYIMPIFKKNERSLVPFFEYLFSKIENINITEIENYNYEQLKKHVKRMQYPKTYKPYFETTVTANISNKMEEKIRNIYGLKQSKIIIEFLQNNHLTLRYTNDIEKAKSLTLLLKKTYKLNLTIK